MSSRPPRTLYLLLFVWIAISMSYYVAGVAALYQKRIHPEQHVRLPFNLDDAQLKLRNLEKEAKAAGLREGDSIETFESEPYTGDFQLTEFMRRARPGDFLYLGLARAQVQIKQTALRLPPAIRYRFDFGLIAYFTGILLVPLLGLLAGYWVVAARPADPNAWFVLVVLTLQEAIFGDIQAVWWGGTAYVVFGFWQEIVAVLAFPALLWFGLFFPERSRIDRKWRVLKWLILAVEAYTLVFTLWIVYLHSFDVQRLMAIHETWLRVKHISGWADTVCIIVFLIAIFDKLRSASTPDARRRLRVLAVGSAFSLGPVLIIFGILPFFGYNPHNGPLFEFSLPFLLLFPLTLAYVLIVQRAMDLGVLLRTGTKYLLAQASLNVVLILITGVLVLRFIVPLIQQKEHQTADLVLIAAMIALLLWAFVGSRSLSNRLQKWLDRKFFREAYNAEIVLSELSEHARRLPEKDLLLDTVSRRISEVLHVPQISVWLRSSNTFQLQYALGLSAFEPQLLLESSATVENLVQVNRPATVYRDRPEEWLNQASSRERLFLDEAAAELLLPLPGRDRLMGIMTLGPKRSEEPYTPTDLRVLQSVATQTGLALEVNELSQSLAKEAALRARGERELEIAHEVQQRLFPQHMPAVAGLSLAGACRPAQGVGGDYYDSFELEDGRLGLAIGDVSGKGISAALLMAGLRACLRTMTLAGSMELRTLMQRMNQLIYEASAVNRYATFFFAIFNPSDRTLRYVNAGHNPPVLLQHRSGSFTRRRLDVGGPPVGLLPVSLYEEQSLAIGSGDVLFAYTDGISEAMTADDEEWGEERMIAAAETAFAGCAKEILEDLFRAADHFTDGATQHDDMTLLIVKA